MIEEAKCLVRDLKEHFKLHQIIGDDYSLERWIIVPDINRPGLELAGFFDHDEPRRVVILGIKEIAYINQMDENLQKERFEQLTDGFTPAIIISENLECPTHLHDIASYKNFPVFASPSPTSQLMIDIISFLDEQLSPVEIIHGVLVNVYGKGVLITGKSGMGKSEIALELIRNGHILIADDRVDVTRNHRNLIGHAPKVLAGMIEVRGIGVINVTQMFGAAVTMSKSNVDFMIELEQWDDNKDYLRIGNEEQEPFECLGLTIPRLVFPVREGRNMAMLIESAVIDLTLKNRGFNSAKEFEDRLFKEIEKKNAKK